MIFMLHEARGALEAGLAGDVGLHGHQVPLLEALRVLPHLDHLAAELVAEDHGELEALLGEGAPEVDVNVRPANGRLLHLHQDLVLPDGGDFDLLEDGTLLGHFLDQGLHLHRGLLLLHRFRCASQ
jgi:hypothetical protein